jgi:hypothetical protein
MTTAIPIIVTALTLFGGFIAWLAQRKVEHRETERRRKEKLYEGLLESIVELSSFGNGAPLLVESQKAWLYASDDVLLAVNEYLKVFLERQVAPGVATTPEEQAARQQKEGSIRLAIRRDLFTETRIDEQWISAQWKPIASSEKAIREYFQRRSKSVS